MKTPLKVVWICRFSNEMVRGRLRFRSLLRKRGVFKDYSVWVTNGIREIENCDDISLTVIFPHYGIRGNKQSFSSAGVDYICYRPEDDSFFYRIRRRLFKVREQDFLRTRALVAEAIRTIAPDYVHLIGAENPPYSICALDVPGNIPLIVSLQTLMNIPDFVEKYPISKAEYEYRASVERRVLCRADYIATLIKYYRGIILKEIRPDAKFLGLLLPVGVEIDLTPSEKKFDFVFFAADVKKGGDDALTAFALLAKRHPEATLNISGGYTKAYKKDLDEKIERLGLAENVFVTGPKSTHAEVLAQIKLSRFAVLPQKGDMISGTIREAISCGLPVVTTITPQTPELNADRDSVLLSPDGDSQMMAENMNRLYEDPSLGSSLSAAALLTVQERYSNAAIIRRWRQVYLSPEDYIE